MPTLQLPTDRRWGDLGAGLGALLGQVVQARQSQQVAQGVGQVMQDPSIADDQKLPTILKQYGDQGASYYTQFVKSQVLRQQLGVQQAQIGREQAQAGLASAETAVLPGKTRAQIDKDAADAQAARARVGLAPGENVKNVEEANLAAAKADKANLEVQRMKAVPQPGAKDDPIEAVVAPAKDQLSEADINSARVQGQQAEMAKPGTGAAVAGRAIDAALRRNQASPDTEKLVSNSTLAATSATAFLKAFDKEPQTGLATGANIKATLEKYGFGTGDANLLAQTEADILQAGTLAQQGGGFFSVGRYNLARDMVPSLKSSPLSNVIRLDQIADRNIADLRSRQDTEPRSTRALQKTVDQWQKVKDWTSSFQTYPITDNVTVMLHNGDQIDKSTFKTLVKGSQTYDVGHGHTITGAQIIEGAMNRKDPQTGAPAPVDPQVYMAALQRQRDQ